MSLFSHSDPRWMRTLRNLDLWTTSIFQTRYTRRAGTVWGNHTNHYISKVGETWMRKQLRKRFLALKLRFPSPRWSYSRLSLLHVVPPRPALKSADYQVGIILTPNWLIMNKKLWSQAPQALCFISEPSSLKDLNLFHVKWGGFLVANLYLYFSPCLSCFTNGNTQANADIFPLRIHLNQISNSFL